MYIGLPSSGLSRHTFTPTLSDATSNIVVDIINGGRNTTVDAWPRTQLLKTHGILGLSSCVCIIYATCINLFAGIFMIVSWLLLAITGIFFASWMKPLLPNGEWFQVFDVR